MNESTPSTAIGEVYELRLLIPRDNNKLVFAKAIVATCVMRRQAATVRVCSSECSMIDRAAAAKNCQSQTCSEPVQRAYETLSKSVEFISTSTLHTVQSTVQLLLEASGGEGHV